MPIVVKAVPKEEFEQWLASEQSAEGVHKAAATAAATARRAGRAGDTCRRPADRTTHRISQVQGYGCSQSRHPAPPTSRARCA